MSQSFKRVRWADREMPLWGVLLFFGLLGGSLAWVIIGRCLG